MFRLAAFVALLATATAFAPAGRVSARSALTMAFEDELGVLPPGMRRLMHFDTTTSTSSIFLSGI